MVFSYNENTLSDFRNNIVYYNNEENDIVIHIEKKQMWIKWFSRTVLREVMVFLWSPIFFFLIDINLYEIELLLGNNEENM